MWRSNLVGLCVVGASCAITACSSPDDHPPSASGGSAGAGGGSGGASSGGSTGGGFSSGGSGGTSPGGGGTSGGGTSGGGTSSGGTEPGTGGVPPSCEPGSGEDAGLTWRDFANDTCKACPATALTECAQFTAAPGPSFDTATKVLTLHVQPGLTEILGLRLEGRASIPASAEYAFVDVDGAVSENVLKFDFSGKLPEGTLGFSEGLLVGDDACGQGIDTSASQKFEIRFSASGAVDRMGCVD
jgi:hypothetical protein